MTTKDSPSLTNAQIKLFWGKVDKTDSCWNWKGKAKKNGYGQFYIHRKPHYAHRIAFQISTGKSTNNLCILHHCDNPLCVNPKHLFGTQRDNVLDCIRKGRSNPPRGSSHPRTHLIEKEVIYIRELSRKGIRTGLIAKMFRIGRQTALSIIKRESWSHI